MLRRLPLRACARRRRRVDGSRRAAAAALAVALAAVACGDQEAAQRQAESAVDGIQATGQLEGRRLAISVGEPEVLDGDCDPNDGRDEDFCVVARTIDGETVALVVENPAVLEDGGRVPVRAAAADADPESVTDHAVVDLRFGRRQLDVTSGSMLVRREGERVAADFDLRFPEGRLFGEFDVRP